VTGGSVGGGKGGVLIDRETRLWNFGLDVWVMGKELKVCFICFRVD
jgi:hypothetical protein